MLSFIPILNRQGIAEGLRAFYGTVQTEILMLRRHWVLCKCCYRSALKMVDQSMNYIEWRSLLLENGRKRKARKTSGEEKACLCLQMMIWSRQASSRARRLVNLSYHTRRQYLRKRTQALGVVSNLRILLEKWLTLICCEAGMKWLSARCTAVMHQWLV